MRQPSTSMYVPPPFLQEANHLHKKDQVTHSVNCEHLYTADSDKQNNRTIYRKKSTQQSTHIAWQVHVFKTIQTLSSPLQYRLANAIQPGYLLVFLVV
jgi:hypothetical protein